jgi:hypothetical protein
MGIGFHFEDETGNTIESIVDTDNLLFKRIPNSEDNSSIAIRFINSYGDTVFNVQ